MATQSVRLAINYNYGGQRCRYDDMRKEKEGARMGRRLFTLLT